MGIRRSILEKVFMQKTVNGVFSDAYIGASATAVEGSIPRRKGQLAIVTASGAISKVYLARVGSNTGSSATGVYTVSATTNAWHDITL